MTQVATKKQWYKKPSKNGAVEYSTDFKFFLENQISVSRSNFTYNFHSMLEAKSFLLTKNVFGDREFSQKQIVQKCKEIHAEVLSGKHGQGEFVD